MKSVDRNKYYKHSIASQNMTITDTNKTFQSFLTKEIIILNMNIKFKHKQITISTEVLFLMTNVITFNRVS